MDVTVTINGTSHTDDVEPRVILVDHIRRIVGLTGTHIGCDTTSCGACTVLLDGTPIKSCTMLAVQADGRSITTVEGLKTNGELHPIQAAFKEDHGLQCGFCTPGDDARGGRADRAQPRPRRWTTCAGPSPGTCAAAPGT